MKYISKLPEPEELQKRFPLDESLKRKRNDTINEIKGILAGKIQKKIIIIGPCSSDREDAVLDYMHRLKELYEKLKDKFLFIPRVYTSKPRTTGQGYKGILHRPNAGSKYDDLLSGIEVVRELHLKVIKETGMFCADEMLYPEITAYLSDLLAYLAIGARSVEDQQHRLVSSGVGIPVGMKNPTSGDFSIMLNAIGAAQHCHSLAYRGYIVETEGNPFSHAILRGYTDSNGKTRPNYHYESICNLYDEYIKTNYSNVAVLIDCNHANSGKNYLEQMRIAKEVIGLCNNHKNINSFVKGLMIESYIEDGNQPVGGGVYGKSITDSCLGWQKTEKLLWDLYRMVS